MTRTFKHWNGSTISLHCKGDAVKDLGKTLLQQLERWSEEFPGRAAWVNSDGAKATENLVTNGHVLFRLDGPRAALAALWVKKCPLGKMQYVTENLMEKTLEIADREAIAPMASASEAWDVAQDRMRIDPAYVGMLEWLFPAAKWFKGDTMARLEVDGRTVAVAMAIPEAGMEGAK